jgi:hypothetical protein
MSLQFRSALRTTWNQSLSRASTSRRYLARSYLFSQEIQLSDSRFRRELLATGVVAFCAYWLACLLLGTVSLTVAVVFLLLAVLKAADGAFWSRMPAAQRRWYQTVDRITAASTKGLEDAYKSKQKRGRALGRAIRRLELLMLIVFVAMVAIDAGGLGLLAGSKNPRFAHLAEACQKLAAYLSARPPWSLHLSVIPFLGGLLAIVRAKYQERRGVDKEAFQLRMRLHECEGAREAAKLLWEPAAAKLGQSLIETLTRPWANDNAPERDDARDEVLPTDPGPALKVLNEIKPALAAVPGVAPAASP